LRALAFLAVLSGCAWIPPAMPTGDLRPRPGQLEALAIVWDAYGRTDRTPAVIWVTGDELDCTQEGGVLGFLVWIPGEGTVCRGGYTSTSDRIFVAWRDGDTFSATQFAHELKHVDLARRGAIDSRHATCEWSAVDLAVAALAAAGL
jgi:hypothetical protein